MPLGWRTQDCLEGQKIGLKGWATRRTTTSRFAEAYSCQPEDQGDHGKQCQSASKPYHYACPEAKLFVTREDNGNDYRKDIRYLHQPECTVLFHTCFYNLLHACIS